METLEEQSYSSYCQVYSIFNKSCVEKFLSNSPFAYRTGKSCVNGLLKMQHTYLATLDKRVGVRMFRMDFSKVFDSIKHDLLVEEVETQSTRPFYYKLVCQFS